MKCRKARRSILPCAGKIILLNLASRVEKSARLFYV